MASFTFVKVSINSCNFLLEMILDQESRNILLGGIQMNSCDGAGSCGARGYSSFEDLADFLSGLLKYVRCEIDG